MPNSSLTKNLLTYCLILIPIVAFWYIFNKYAINIPHWDDYAVRNSLVSFLNTDSFAEKIKILFAQHNEHRIFLTRLTALCIYIIKDTLDFKWMMFLGNLSLVGIFILFFKISKKYNLTLFAIVPVSFILFNAGLFENTFWGMASIQNFGVIFFAFLTFYWLVFSIEHHNNKYFYFAFISCFFGVFSSYNGIVIPIIGLLILIFQQRKQAIFTWIGISFILLAGYFYSFVQNPEKSSKTDFSNPILLVKGLFVTLGNAIDCSFVFPDKHIDLSMAIGVFLAIFMTLFAVQTIFKKYNLSKKNNNLFLLACLTFLAITCVGIVLARSSFGFGILLTSKYKIYSLLILIIFYLVALEALPSARKNNFVQLATLAAIVFNIYTFIADYQSFRLLNQERITDQFKQIYSDKDYAKEGLIAKMQQPAPLATSTLAVSGATRIYKNFLNTPYSNVWYPTALAEALSGKDLNAGDYDINVTLNSSTNWYFGTDAKAQTGKYDLITVTMHEIAHGLGFSSSMEVVNSDTQGQYGQSGSAYVYDVFMQDSQKIKLTNTGVYGNPSQDLKKSLTSNALYFGLKNSKFANALPRLYAPSPFKDGVSFSHFDESTYPSGSVNSLMSPSVRAAEVNQNPGELLLNCLNEMGWQINGLVGYVVTDTESVPEQTLEVKVFPNPATDILNVAIPLQNQPRAVKIVLLNSNGLVLQSIENQFVTVETFTIDVSNLIEGMYLLRVQDGEKTTVRKIVK